MASLTVREFEARIGRPETVADVVRVIDRLSPDPALEQYRRDLRTVAAEGRRYWDLACALNVLARRLEPSTYLEIGVRRGKSMAQVASRQPGCNLVGMDLWVSPYGGVENPGPDFVRAEIRRVGHRGRLTLLSGDSRTLLPRWLIEHPDQRFDLVTVDGDHSDEGAWADLVAVVELLRPGGYLVFDDLVHPAHSLLGVWRRFQERYGALFEWTENTCDHNGTAVARRRP